MTTCGLVAGCLIEPFTYDLIGSTFTMTRVADDAALAALFESTKMIELSAVCRVLTRSLDVDDRWNGPPPWVATMSGGATAPSGGATTGDEMSGGQASGSNSGE